MNDASYVDHLSSVKYVTNVPCPVVTHVHFANRYLQKKGVNLDNGHHTEKKQYER